MDGCVALAANFCCLGTLVEQHTDDGNGGVILEGYVKGCLELPIHGQQIALGTGLALFGQKYHFRHQFRTRTMLQQDMQRRSPIHKLPQRVRIGSHDSLNDKVSARQMINLELLLDVFVVVVVVVCRAGCDCGVAQPMQRFHRVRFVSLQILWSVLNQGFKDIKRSFVFDGLQKRIGATVFSFRTTSTRRRPSHIVILLLRFLPNSVLQFVPFLLLEQNLYEIQQEKDTINQYHNKGTFVR